MADRNAGVSGMRTMTVGGERWLPAADIVTALRDMASGMGDGPARQNLLTLARMFGQLLGAHELLPATDSQLQAVPCPRCGTAVLALVRHGSDQPITLSARPVPYGRWVVVAPFDRPPCAVDYSLRRPGAQRVARHREHVCGTSKTGPADEPGEAPDGCA